MPRLVGYSARTGDAKKRGRLETGVFVSETRTWEVVLVVVKRAYSRKKVKSVELQVLLARCVGNTRVHVGLDVAKREIVACLRWGEDDFERPWSVGNPSEIGELVQLLASLREKLEVVVALESTGTYGDAVRMALTAAKIRVVRISGKHVADYSEIFDGVPSKHDGKDAAMIADLAAKGKGADWSYVAETEFQAELRYYVRRLSNADKQRTALIGKLEAELSRYWPELSEVTDLGAPTTLKLLSAYGSPAEAVKNQQLRSQLRSWAGRLKSETIEHIVASCSSPKGLPMNQYDIRWVKELAQQALQVHQEISCCEKSIEAALAKDEFWSQYMYPVGPGTLAVLLTTVGDLRKYPNSGALLKALGLNLKERSSGQRQGQLAITKRGSALARRWLFFWAMRAVQRPSLQPWFARFQNSHHKHGSMIGLVSMMRKLVRSLRRCVHDNTEFTYEKVIEPISKKANPRKRKRKKPTFADARYED